MYFYPVYRYRSDADRTFVRVGSIMGYAGPTGSRTHASLLREARRLFSRGPEDVILIGHSPVASHARAPSAAETAEPVDRSGNAEQAGGEADTAICS